MVVKLQAVADDLFEPEKKCYAERPEIAVFHKPSAAPLFKFSVTENHYPCGCCRTSRLSIKLFEFAEFVIPKTDPICRPPCAKPNAEMHEKTYDADRQLYPFRLQRNEYYWQRNSVECQKQLDP
ncbi:MAG TPA: hypothetical protein VHZ04_00750 [Candidatus Paceibacterota bacterium]|nr:hypothetical protein [Candidatus Paceibacterota bacterium]